jgi:hypothetical protein
MRITFNVKDVSDTFYARLEPMSASERLEYLLAKSAKGSGLEQCVKAKIGSGQFRDAVEYNALKRTGVRVECEGPLPRRGYRLFTFEVRQAA